MHPILGQLRRLGFYLFALIALEAILLHLLAALGGLSWPRAAALAIPLCGVYAFVCLSAWYSCRGTPLETSSFSRLALTHLCAAVVAGGIWIVVAKVLAGWLFSVFAWAGPPDAKEHPPPFWSGEVLLSCARARSFSFS